MQVIKFTTLEFIGKTHLKDLILAKTNDLYAGTFTSGTSNMPKGLMLTRKNVVVGISRLNAFYDEVGNNVNAIQVLILYFPTIDAVDFFQNF